MQRIKTNQSFDSSKKEDNFWDLLSKNLNDKEINEMQQRAINDLGFDPHNLKPVGKERI